MRKKGFLLWFTVLLLLTGCGKNNEETISGASESEALLDAFLAGDIPAVYDSEKESAFMYDQLPADEEDYFGYSVGERIDLDNDGENELIVNGPYGGIYFDARDGKVYVLAEGEGTTGVLFYTSYDNATWIVHSDTMHMGREMYWLTRYDGEGNIVDEFLLGAQYWDSSSDRYDENSDFTYRDEKISMEEYEALREEILFRQQDGQTEDESSKGSDAEWDKEQDIQSIKEEFTEILETDATIEIPNLPETGQELSDFILDGWELLDSVKLDFNEDGLMDYVGVLDAIHNETGEEGWQKSVPRILFAVESGGQEGYQLSFQDINLIRTRDEGGVFGDPYCPMTARKDSFTTHAYGGSAWRWSEDYTYTYKEGIWYLTASAYSYGYYGNISTAYETNNWKTGVGIRQRWSDNDYNMEEERDGEYVEPDFEYELSLDEPVTLYQAGMRGKLAPDRRTDWNVSSIELADGVTISKDMVKVPKEGILPYYNDENGILYSSYDENSEIYYLTWYTFEDQSLFVVTEEKAAIDHATVYKNKIYYAMDITGEITYKAVDGDEKVLKEKEDTIGMALLRMNLDGTGKEVVFEYRYPEAEGEILEYGMPYLDLLYEVSGNEIVVEMYLGYDEPHPFYRMNIDGSGVRKIGQVPK